MFGFFKKTLCIGEVEHDPAMCPAQLQQGDWLRGLPPLHNQGEHAVFIIALVY